MGVFYNRNIDQIAMICPVCELVSKKIDRLTGQALANYEEHLRVNHGMVR